jgi:hypothetical protein
MSHLEFMPKSYEFNNSIYLTQLRYLDENGDLNLRVILWFLPSAHIDDALFGQNILSLSSSCFPIKCSLLRVLSKMFHLTPSSIYIPLILRSTPSSSHHDQCYIPQIWKVSWNFKIALFIHIALSLRGLHAVFEHKQNGEIASFTEMETSPLDEFINNIYSSGCI